MEKPMYPQDTEKMKKEHEGKEKKMKKCPTCGQMMEDK